MRYYVSGAWHRTCYLSDLDISLLCASQANLEDRKVLGPSGPSELDGAVLWGGDMGREGRQCL
jgi:hypothetical protein